MRNTIPGTLLALFASLSGMVMSGQVSLTSGGLKYLEDFDTLPVPAENGEALEWTNGVTLLGWYRDLMTSQGSVDNSRNWSGDGSAATSSVPALFNWGSEGTNPVAERALGLRVSTNQRAVLCVVFRNDSPRDILGAFIRYNGEQWRRSGQLEPTRLAFGFKTASAFDTDGYSPAGDTGLTPVPELDFISPVFTTGGRGTDGNSSSYSRQLSASITFPEPARPGGFVILRWEYEAPAFSGHGLAIDNLAVNFLPDSAAQGATLGLLDSGSDRHAELRWSAAPGFVYSVEKTDSLRIDDWRAQAEIGSTSEEASWIDPDPLGRQAFYRIRSLEAERSVHVADFGAVPGDGLSDTAAINDAIQGAIRFGYTRVVFDAGTYELIETSQVDNPRNDNYIGLFNAANLALIGAVDGEGRPATRLERKLQLTNDTDPFHLFDIWYCNNLVIRNFILANDPPLGSTARVVTVDRANDVVEVEVLDGLPAYDGMRAASAHVWDLSTGKLRRFGNTPEEATLNFGLSINDFWQAVSGTGARRLRMAGSGWADKVQVGDGITWHHRPVSRNQTEVMYSSNLTFENISMPNLSNMAMLAGYNHNLTFRRVRLEPENGNLAVGARDGFHLSNNSGALVFEDCYLKGLRMDPLVLRRTYGIVQEVLSDGRVVVRPGYLIPAGDSLRFWAGPDPADRVVTSVESLGDSTYAYGLSEPVPAGAGAGTPLNFLTYSLASGIIRNCVFEDSFGSPIVNFEENITVEDCVFDNNSYQIKYGPNPTSGGFVRHNIFRNNVIENTSWIDIAGRGQPACLLIHSISSFFTDPKYNKDILITGNTFRNPHGDPNHAAIEVRNATDVDILANVFEGFVKSVVADPATTERINVND